MLLAEPPPTPYDLRFTLLGIPVRVHPFFWLAALILGIDGRLGAVLIWLAALFLAILGHELGHAVAFRWYGYRPMITLHGLGGLTTPGPALAYGARRLRPLDNILISLAGPGAGFLMAAAVCGAIILARHPVVVEVGRPYGIMVSPGDIVVSLGLTNFLVKFLFICVTWGLVNLLPIFPLDGGQVTREILVAANPRDGARQALILSILTAVLMAFVGFAQWHSFYVAIFFAFLAFESFTLLQSYTGRGPW